MAIACLRLVTFLPERPLFSFPRFISCISVSTFLPAEGEYLRVEVVFFEAVLRAVVFFTVFFAADFFARFFVDDFFAAVLRIAFLVAMAHILLHSYESAEINIRVAL